MSELRSLIVEDSKLMRDMLAQALGRIPGMTVVEADNGFDALRMITQQVFHLVVTDINMPVMDGLKLVRQLRRDPRHARVPIIIVSTEAAPTDRNRALSLGANAYLQKPIRAPEVIKTVRKLLEV